MKMSVEIVGEPISKFLKIRFIDTPPDIYRIAIRPYIKTSIYDFVSAEKYENLKIDTEISFLVYEYQEKISDNWYLYRFAGSSRK